MLHELLKIAQTAPGRYQFIAELEREITHPLGALTHTRKLLIYQGILYICGNQLHKLGLIIIEGSYLKYLNFFKIIYDQNYFNLFL